MSYDLDDRREFSSLPPVMVRLTAEAAESSGLLSEWALPWETPVLCEELQFTQKYDWTSSVWSTGYPGGFLEHNRSDKVPMPWASKANSRGENATILASGVRPTRQ